MKTYEMIYRILFQAKGYVSAKDLSQQVGLSPATILQEIKALEQCGLEIEVSRDKGYKLICGDLLFPCEIEQDLQIPIHLSRENLSTQLDARAGIEAGHSSPALYLATHQEQAKGRFGRSFFTSRSGGIYMTLHLADQTNFPSPKPYTMLVAAAIIKAITNLTNLTPQIKWVNDIYLKNRKVAGILTEAIPSSQSPNRIDILIGIGLNFHIPIFPEDLAMKATSLFTSSPPISRQQLITEIWRVFFSTSERELLALYKEKSLVLGRQVFFSQGHTTYKGQAIDLTDTGELVIQLEDGRIKHLNSGEISLSSWS